MPSREFNYSQAFSRNLGWVTAAEQAVLRTKCVAIAGMGGVGGVHLVTLARLGIGKFRIADFDCFDLPNFNRQAGATTATVGLPKAQVMADMVKEINPQAEITIFAAGIDATTVDAFISGADIYVDGLDFFAFDARAITFAACSHFGVPAVTAAPLGMGAAVLNFLPGRMSFETYFGWHGQSEQEKALRFMVGLAPRLLHDYIVVPGSVDLDARKGPSTVMACQLCAGIAATEVLKILLGRGDLRCAPAGLHFDAYRNKMVTTWRPWGVRNPLQQLILVFARWRLRQLRTAKSAAVPD